jgi:hypothetical protein
MLRAISTAINFHYSDRDPGENQLKRFSLIDAVQAMEWRCQKILSQEEVNALNIYLSMCEQNLIDYDKNVIYPWLQHG